MEISAEYITVTSNSHVCMEEVNYMQRIMINGSSGSGTTALSQLPSKKFNLPLYHLDLFFWKPIVDAI